MGGASTDQMDAILKKIINQSYHDIAKIVWPHLYEHFLYKKLPMFDSNRNISETVGPIHKILG